MKKVFGYATILLLSSAAVAQEQRGQLLYENHCQACHTSIAHLRTNRLATTPEALRKQIVRWQTHLNLGWTAEEIDAVYRYLNALYYKF